MLTWNLVLAVIWCALLGNFNLVNMIGGLAVGYMALAVLGKAGISSASLYSIRIFRAFSFFFYFIKELWIANIRVAIDVVTPRLRANPGVVAIPLDAKTDMEITLLAMFITLTPGTLALEVSSDRSELFIHAMFIDNDDIDALVRTTKEGFERRLLEVLR